VILAHHGCSVLGADLAMAGRRAANLEEAARLTYRALLLGRETPGPPWGLPETGLI
jgi:L-fuculose-phosphate aldolase